MADLPEDLAEHLASCDSAWCEAFNVVVVENERLRDALFAFLPGSSTPPCRHCGFTSVHQPDCPYEAARHLLDKR